MNSSATLSDLQKWMASPSETEHLEFKTAESQFDFPKLLNYCCALANEGGGHLILGVTNKTPRRVVGTKLFKI
jgi:ATP-dependent DNA helicase RecG